MKLLNGAEVAEFIKERQAGQVRGLKQAHGVNPHLAIIRTNPEPVVDSYMKLKQSYGDDVGVQVTVHTIEQSEAAERIQQLNQDATVHGIIVQLPLPDVSETDTILNLVAANKDVDGLAKISQFDPATPLSIVWLLAAYNINLKSKTIAVVGQGRLVGAPLSSLLEKSGYTVVRLDRSSQDIAEQLQQADVIITATGRPGLITTDMVKPQAVIVDAGVATDSNGLVGDVDPSVRSREDITITPEKGGVGPLTVCALFENVINAAKASA